MYCNPHRQDFRLFVHFICHVRQRTVCYPTTRSKVALAARVGGYMTVTLSRPLSLSIPWVDPVLVFAGRPQGTHAGARAGGGGGRGGGAGGRRGARSAGGGG